MNVIIKSNEMIKTCKRTYIKIITNKNIKFNKSLQLALRIDELILFQRLFHSFEAMIKETSAIFLTYIYKGIENTSQKLSFIIVLAI